QSFGRDTAACGATASFRTRAGESWASRPVELGNGRLDLEDAQPALPCGARAFRRALNDLLLLASRAVEDGAAILILSDRGVDARHAALPILLAVSAVHHHLLRQGLRLRTSIVAETGEARDDHQIAMLFGYGASAVNPYLALETVRAVVSESSGSEQEADEAAVRYLKSLSKGLLKVL